jgi:hypothetical protein
MIDTSSLSVVCRRVHALFIYLCYLCVLAYSGVQHFVRLCVLTSLVPCCDVRYGFSHINDVRFALPPVVCRKVNVLFMLFVSVCG